MTDIWGDSKTERSRRVTVPAVAPAYVAPPKKVEAVPERERETVEVS